MATGLASILVFLNMEMCHPEGTRHPPMLTGAYKAVVGSFMDSRWWGNIGLVRRRRDASRTIHVILLR